MRQTFTFRKYASILVLVGLCFGVLRGQAQEKAGGANVHIGDLELDFRGNIGQTYDSNIGLSPDNAKSDWITRVGLLLMGEAELTEINTLRLSIGAEYRKYWNNPQFDSDQNSLILTPKTGLELLLQAGNFDFRLYDDFSLLSDPGDNRFINPNTGASLTNIVIYNRIQNQLGLDGTWTINPYWNANAGIYRLDIVPMDNQFQDLQRNSHVATAGLSHNMAANLDVNTQLSTSIDRWETNLQPDSSSWSAGAGADWRMTDLTELEFFLSWMHRSFEPDTLNGVAGRSTDGLTGNLALTHQVNPDLQHSIRYRRSIDLGSVSNAITSQAVEYRIDYAGFERSDVFFEIFWNDGVESGIISPERYERWTLRTGLGYPLSEQLEFSLRLEHSFRESNTVNRDYSRNMLSVTLTYDF